MATTNSKDLTSSNIGGKTATSNGNNAYVADYTHAFKEQSGKAKTQRLTLELPTSPAMYFQAHIDPQDLTHSAEKRIAQLDTLTGVVIQDFGYKPESIELRGTTGLAYFIELNQMQSIFKNQNLKTPQPVKVTIEDRTYQCLWQGFAFQRQINSNSGNIYMYTMSFIVLKTGMDRIARRQAYKSADNKSLGYTVNTITIPGQSIDDYLKSVSIVPADKPRALAILAKLWNNAPNNGSFPKSNIKLTANQKLTVPADWKLALDAPTVLSGVPSGIA